MTEPLWALVAILGLGSLAQQTLRRSAWPSRHPGAAIVGWHVLATLSAVSITWLALLLSHDPAEHLLVWALGADKSQVHHAYAGHRSVGTSWDLALLAPAALVSCAAWRASRWVRNVERRRRALAALPERVVQRFTYDGVAVTLCPQDHPSLHCLPGVGGGQVVMSTGAQDLLDASELDAALAHERAHLSRRHHRSVLLAHALSTFLRRIGQLRSYRTEVERLVELEADDVAARHAGPYAVASALMKLSQAPGAPTPALHFAREHAAERVRRLLSQMARPGALAAGPGVVRASRPLPAALTVGLAALVPTLIAALPALTLIGTAG